MQECQRDMAARDKDLAALGHEMAAKDGSISALHVASDEMKRTIARLESEIEDGRCSLQARRRVSVNAVWAHGFVWSVWSASVRQSSKPCR